MKAKPSRKRLDLLLVERGFADSPQKAAAMVLAGEVQVDGKRAEKAGLPVASTSQISVASRQQKYASRGGVKLEGALADFSFDPAGLVCLDIGSSHGGFTDCLLQRGAACVYAVDVNIAQLDWKLRQDARVTRIERNARDLRVTNVPELVDLVTIDVSFISACKVIAPAAKLSKSGAHFFILVKPQFELRREEIGRGGIVSGKKLHEKAILAVRQSIESLGFDILGVRPSHLSGAEGNQEYFLHARKKPLE
jgi:23S rRNA (cytidine1920-2'-O)/16S rRNA (cytidine1409-2'-O)-methyltransferase